MKSQKDEGPSPKKTSKTPRRKHKDKLLHIDLAKKFWPKHQGIEKKISQLDDIEPKGF